MGIMFEDITGSEMGEILFECFVKLINIQEERVKKRGIRGLLSKLTGAFVPGAEQEQEKSQENVQENIEERNDEDERE